MTVNLSLFAGAGWQFFDNNGLPLSGGLIYSYVAGTTTPLTTYTNNIGNVAQSNPIVLNASGRIPTGEIWLTQGDTYKFVIEDSNSVLIGTYDNILGANDQTVLNAFENTLAGSTGSSLVGYNEGGTGAVTRTVQNRLQDFITVKDFGAVADWTSPSLSTDNTSSFQKAIDYCFSLGGGTIYIPEGKYYVAGTLYMKNNVRILGSGSGYDSAATEIHSNSNLFYFSGQLDCAIEYLEIYGLDTNTGSAIYIDASNTVNLYVGHILVRNMYSAVWMASNSVLTLADFYFCKFIYNRYWHWYMDVGVAPIVNALTFNSCSFDAQSNAAQAGLFKHSTGTLGFTYFNECIFQSSASPIAVDLGASCYAAFNNCLFFYNGIADGACHINIGGGQGLVSVKYCNIAGAAPSATNFYDIIKSGGSKTLPLIIDSCSIQMESNIIGAVSTTQMSSVSAINNNFIGNPYATEYDMLQNAGYDVVRVNNINDSSRAQIITNIVTTVKTTDATITTIQGGTYVVKASTNYYYIMNIVGRSESGATYYAATIRDLYSVDAGKTITYTGSASEAPITSGEVGLGYSYAFQANGADAAGIVIMVQGVAATNITWVCELKIIAVGDNAGFYP